MDTAPTSPDNPDRDFKNWKKAQDLLLASETRYRRLFETTQDGILILDAGTGQIVDANPFLINLLGFSHEQFLGKKIWEIGVFKDIVANKKNFKELQRQEHIRYEDLPLQTADGRNIAVEFVSNVYEVDNKKVIQCNIRDITERKLAEKALADSGQRLIFSLESADIGAWSLDLVTHTAWRSLRHDQIFGYEELLPEWTYEMFLNHVLFEDRSMVDIKFKKAMENFLDWNFECRIRRKDGAICWIWVNGRPEYNDHHEPKKMFGLVQDITTRKRVEVALNTSEVRYRRLFETAQDGILILDADTGQIVDANPFLIDMLGFSHEQFLGKKIWEIGVFKDVVANKDNFEELQRQEYIRYEDLPLETADGRRIAVEFVSNVYMVNDKKVIQCNIRNITERKLAEEALRESEERFSQVAESAGEWIWEVDADGLYLYSSPAVENMLGYKMDEIVGRMHFYDLFAPEVKEELKKATLEAFATQESFRDFINPNLHKNGNRVILATSGVPHLDDEGRFVGYRGVDTDITERRKMTEQIEASLAEKEMLLKEIHHRVKNNLQIIASVLNLQIRRIDDPKTIEVLKDCQSRVRSMSLVHEQLHRGNDISHVNLGNYIRALGTVLFNSYDARDRGIRFEVDIPDINVDINTAIPLGLISNELVTNCLKYAFKEKKDGILSITAREDLQSLTFIVADNGAGMPEHITLEDQTTLGLQLVSSLTDQLNGTVVIDRTGGTKFKFTFPRPEEKKP